VRARLIANPKSGSDRATALVPLITERLRPVVSDLDVVLTTGEQDIVDAAESAVDDNRQLLLVAGGDGTLNIAVRSIAAVDGALGKIVFGVIPAGTGNDFVKALDIGEDPERALEVLTDARVIDVDLGMLNDRAFINVSAGGFVADVSAILTEDLKDATGKLAYVIGGARALFGREPFATDVQVTGRTYASDLDLQMFAVCNARFIGGGYPIAPGAVLDDGLLDVFLVKRTPTLEFVGLLQKIAAAQHEDDERILHVRTDDLELVFDRSVHVNTDGELLEAQRCRYRLRPRAARFLCGPRPQALAEPRPWRTP
jgi:diacylglycerol kinase (ATP)